MPLYDLNLSDFTFLMKFSVVAKSWTEYLKMSPIVSAKAGAICISVVVTKSVESSRSIGSSI